MVYLLALGIAVAFYVVEFLDVRGATGKPWVVPISPDGRSYLAMGRGDAVANPFNLRWLLPKLLGDAPRKWWVCSGLCAVLTAPVLVWYLSLLGVSPTLCLVGVGLYLGLPGVFRTSVLFPVLTDAAAALSTVLIAALVLTVTQITDFGHGFLAVPSALLLIALWVAVLTGGAVRETVPVFAAVAAWHWFPLIGIVPVAVRWFTAEKPADGNSPLVGFKTHGNMWWNAPAMLLPWGACLVVVAAPAVFWLPLTVGLALGYGQLLIATDRARLYMGAYPLVIAAALAALNTWNLPTPALVALVLAHWFNPFRKVI